MSLIVEHVMSSDEGVALEKLRIGPKGLREPVNSFPTTVSLQPQAWSQLLYN